MVTSIQAAKEMTSSLSAQSRGSGSSVNPENSGLNGSLHGPDDSRPRLALARDAAGAEQVCDASFGRQAGWVPGLPWPWAFRPLLVSSALGFPSFVCGFCHRRSIRPIVGEPS